MTKSILAWHFVYDNLRLRDGNTVAAGYRYEVQPPIVLCFWGLHASRKILDAITYAPGCQICRVRMSGDIIMDSDKLVATQREVLWIVDATTLLHEFACWCAERALKAERAAGREPAPASWRAIKVKRAWLRGQATDDELSAVAQAATWAAAEATWEARGAAWPAARAARAARANERAAQERKLLRMVAIANED